MSLEPGVVIFGLLALCFNFVAYRQGTPNRYRFISGFALGFLGLHFLLLDALAAAIGLLLGSLRNFVALRYRQKSIVVLFVIVNVLFCLWEWLILQHSNILFIAYTASIIFTVGTIMLNSAAAIRRWFILAESLMFLYALLVFSPFGMLYNLSNLTSILTKLRQERGRRLARSRNL